MRGRGRRAGQYSRRRRGRRKVAQESRFDWGTGSVSAPERGECFWAACRRIFQETARQPKNGPGGPFCLGNWPQICPGEGGVLFGLRRCAPSRQPAQVRRPRDFGSTLYTLYIYNVTNVNGDRGQGRSPARNRQKPYKMDVNTPGPARLKVYNRDIEPANPARARLGQPAHPARAQLGRTQGGQAWLSALGGA